MGLLYDSSIYPVRHDRYGIPDAPRGPFLAQGAGTRSLRFLQRPCASAELNVPVGGGGYFRLLPFPLDETGTSHSAVQPAVEPRCSTSIPGSSTPASPASH